MVLFHRKLFILTHPCGDMKEIRIALEDSEYAILKKAKRDLTWKEFLMSGGSRRDGNEDIPKGNDVRQ